MPLVPLTLDMVGAILRNLDASECPSRKLLSLGFPDILASREHVREIFGGEIVHDLNLPIPDRMKSRYALVLDTGTLEHCFNIAQAAKNVAEIVALGGAAMHGNPLNMYNHGFYNLNPTWYHDFYSENGFVVEYLKLVADAVGEPRTAEIPPFGRFSDVPENCSLLAVARRAEHREIRWPIQRKYRDNPILRG